MLHPIVDWYLDYCFASNCKLVECENCGAHFRYDLWRLGKGRSFCLGMLGRSRARKCAVANAKADLLNRLNEIDAVPCPRCGCYQAAMVSLLRKTYHRWVKWLALGLPLGVFATVGVIAMLRLEGALDIEIPWPVLVAALGIAMAVGFMLVVARAIIASGWDPNAPAHESSLRAARTSAFLLNDEEVYRAAHQAAEKAHARDFERLLEVTNAPLFGTALVGVPTMFFLVSLMWGETASGLRSLYWTPTQGAVQKAWVLTKVQRSERGEAQKYYLPQIEYTYMAAGNAYTGSRYSFWNAASFDATTYRDLPEQFPPGTPTDVHYDPSEPGESVLHTGVAWNMILAVVFVAAVDLACFVWCCHCVRRLIIHWKQERLLDSGRWPIARVLTLKEPPCDAPSK